MNNQNHRIIRNQSILVVVDIQERLLPAIHAKERVVDNAVRLIKGAVSLGIPTLFTEQYRKGLGPTVAEVAQASSSFAPIEKLTFSACGEPRFLEGMTGRGKSDVILCGIEAHVCVSQTALDLIAAGYRVFVVADAVSSRTPENHQLGLQRLQARGASIVSTEMILFELLERASTDAFKQILQLVK